MFSIDVCFSILGFFKPILVQCHISIPPGNVFEFLTYDILKIIRNLNQNKTRLKYDQYSNVKICDESICKLLGIIFGHVQKMRSFPQNGRKASEVPVLKNNKGELKNYRSIPLLPVSGKIFERLLYDSMFKFFIGHAHSSQFMKWHN